MARTHRGTDFWNELNAAGASSRLSDEGVASGYFEEELSVAQSVERFSRKDVG